MSIEAAFFGSLGRDADHKTSKSGKPYLRLSVRVGDGDDVQWLTVMAFDENAIEAAEKYVKAARVYVEGRLSTNEWTGQDGTKRLGLSVMSWHCRLSQIGRNRPKRKSANDEAGRPLQLTAAADTALDDAIPF